MEGGSEWNGKRIAKIGIFAVAAISVGYLTWYITKSGPTWSNDDVGLLEDLKHQATFFHDENNRTGRENYFDQQYSKFRNQEHLLKDSSLIRSLKNYYVAMGWTDWVETFARDFSWKYPLPVSETEAREGSVFEANWLKTHGYKK